MGNSYQQLAELTILSLQLIHQFTMHLPGFCKLSDEDKRTLHKVRSFFNLQFMKVENYKMNY